PEDIYGADQFRCPRSAGGHCQAATAAGSLGYQGSMPKGNLHTILDLTPLKCLISKKSDQLTPIF
ncbi:MAG: hypothetical protein IKG67_05485, partial [Parasporobacterium sp.]|nr:hypothetical protein [Parasporobacterium sp.]